ncbi:COMM domain-containing protein 4-like [Oscarella lobularis]|uniref:COMM domain-containing protein 4-like n=1 Tax=Oscarella lobularis TaxID=121494 RepID=UPI0033131FB9
MLSSRPWKARLVVSMPFRTDFRNFCGNNGRDDVERCACALCVNEVGVISSKGKMKFRFCGDLDCPDWVLAEISILSKITSVKMKQLCVQVIRDLIDDSIDYAKIFKLTADAKYESSDVRAAVATLSFILSSAAKYNVDSETLSSELQQLGLPKELSAALCRAYGDGQTKLQDSLRQNSLRLSRLRSVDWRVDYVLSSNDVTDVDEPFVQIKINKEGSDSVAFTASPDKFRLLLNELKQVYALMEGQS